MKFTFLILTTLLIFGCDNKESHTEHPELIFAEAISNNNVNVLSDVNLFLSGKEAYKEKYRDNLEYHGYETPFDNEFDLTFVIIQSMISNKLAIVVDWKEDPQFVFDSLNEASDKKLSSCENYGELKSDFVKTGYNITYYLNSIKQKSLLARCLDNLELTIIGIDDGSDSFALSLVSSRQITNTLEYAEKSNVKLTNWKDGA